MPLADALAILDVGMLVVVALLYVYWKRTGQWDD